MFESKKLSDPASVDDQSAKFGGKRPAPVAGQRTWPRRRFDWLTLEVRIQDDAEVGEGRPIFDPSTIHFVILIPVYKHSVVLAEAIESALSQKIDGGLCVVIVNDGCPHPETDELCTVFSQSRAEIVYLHKPNGGPSSARNLAIDFAVGNFPNLKAAFFLDADNRLSPDAFATGWALLQQHPEVSWVYPHVSTFEVEWSGDYNIHYSRLLHVVHDNLCDTGSVIRADLLRRLRFNDSARSGFEDWDYWLSAIAEGHKGLCGNLLGFEYRNRAESRFKEVSRDRGAVTNYLKDRYKKVFTPKRLLQFEHEEAPRFCFFEVSTGVPSLFTDPALSWRRVSIDDFTRNYWAARVEPEKFLVPNILIWGSDDIMGRLAETGMAHNILWLVERQLKERHFVVVTIVGKHEEINVEIRDIDAATPVCERAMFIAGRRDIVENCVCDSSVDWLRSLTCANPGPRVTEITYAAPTNLGRKALPTAFLLDAIISTVTTLRNSPFNEPNQPRWNWRARIFPALNEYPALLEKYLRAETLLPRAKPAKRADIGFVVPFGSYGGAEKVSYAAAMELRKNGYAAHLFVIGGKDYKVISEFEDAFDSVVLVGKDIPSLWGGSKQGRGTEFATADDPWARSSLLIGLLSTMDVVINCQSAPMNAAIGDLRQLGIMTISYIHLFDRSQLEREVGHPFLGLLFEHAYDLFVLCSHQLRHRLHALGMPSAKMLTVENAPSFTIPPATLAKIAESRRRPSASKTLKALYIGRMDAQKGIERILGIVEAVGDAGLDISFRFIGSSLVEDVLPEHTRVALHRSSVTFEQPIFSSSKLATAFAEVDVMILASRWEGAPLVILEAQQAGCIPIATDVGAVSELIDHGKDGILVPDGRDADVISYFVVALRKLQKDEAMRRKLALAAMDRLSVSSWERSFAALVDELDKRFSKNS